MILDRRRKQEQFWLLERLASFFYSTGITATQDILEATEIPSSLVLLAAAGPACLISVLYQYFFQRIPVLVASCAIFTLSITGMLLTALAQLSAQGEAYWSVHIATRSRQHRDGVLSFISFLWRKHGEQLRFWLRNFMSSRTFVIRR